MRPGAVLLPAAAALVAVGGVYLLLEVRASGAAAPSDTAVAEAAARHARTGPSMAASRGPRPDSGIPGPDPAPAQARKPRAAFADVAASRPPGRAVLEGDAPGPEAVDGNADFETAMLETNKLYDRHNYEEARAMALKLLDKQPGTVRMQRVVVSSSCILGDADTAQKYWTELPEFDRGQMTTRCERFGITFK